MYIHLNDFNFEGKAFVIMGMGSFARDWGWVRAILGTRLAIRDGAMTFGGLFYGELKFDII
jgi:hypothetical protein